MVVVMNIRFWLSVLLVTQVPSCQAFVTAPRSLVAAPVASASTSTTNPQRHSSSSTTQLQQASVAPQATDSSEETIDVPVPPKPPQTPPPPEDDPRSASNEKKAADRKAKIQKIGKASKGMLVLASALGGYVAEQVLGDSIQQQQEEIANSFNTNKDGQESNNPQQPIESFSSNNNNKPSYDHYDAVVCGGGPAGLLTAIMLTRKFGPSYKIAVCEQRATVPPSPSDATVWNDIARFYLLGIGYRGQSALQKFGVYDDFVKASVEVKGRRDWQPGMTNVEDGKVTLSNRDPPSRVLPRDKLVGVLHEHLVTNYLEEANIDLLYGYQVEPLDLFGTDDDDSKVSIRITKCEDMEDTADGYKGSQDSEQLCDVDNIKMVTTDFLIGADGAARTVANAMEVADKERVAKMNPVRKLFAKSPFAVKKFDDDNPRVYKSVPIQLPADWPKDLNYSARSRKNRITLEALPSDADGNLCALLLMKPDDELAQPNVDPKLLQEFFNEEFPQFSTLIDDEEMKRIATKEASRLPVFRYAGGGGSNKLHVGKRTIVLGDAAHTVKPYYGLGCNTALEDVEVLSDILDNCNPSSPSSDVEDEVDSKVLQAVPTFSKQRAGDAAALVTMSRNMDRSGKMFIVSFLLPIILDGIFHKMAPKIFGPNMFGMFNIKGMSFKQIQRKKRLDRTLQLVIISSLLTGAGFAVKTAVRLLSQAIGVHQRSIYAIAAATGILASQLKKRLAAKEKRQF